MRKITFVNLQTFYKFCDLADADGIHFRAYEQPDGSFQVKMEVSYETQDDQPY